MKTRPILMSTPMVQALLEGRKTQTRRVIKPQPLDAGDKPDKNARYFWKDGVFALNCYPDNSTILKHCPYGKVGDVLWVRESFGLDGTGAAIYCADKTHENWELCVGWKLSIHMPRCLSRITLEISDIRVERLQDISEEDAIAEGISFIGIRRLTCSIPVYHHNPSASIDESFDYPHNAYWHLWESINGKGSWDLNPWVWVIEFKVHLMNVDDYLSQNRDKAK